MTFILGINAYHGDASACLMKSGSLIAAAEEERFNRIKHWAGLPVEAVKYCLAEGGITLESVRVIAVNSSPRANFWRRGLYAVRRRPNLHFLLDRMASRRRRASVATEIADALGEARFSGEVHHVEHHAAHLASAFLVSPFDTAATLSIDGFGDFASTAWGLGHESSVKVQGRIHFPHSLGIFYETITHYLGFKRYGDEYKVMGLAPYGRPRFLREMEQVLRLEGDGRFSLGLEYFRHHRGEVSFTWDGCEPLAGDYFTEALESLLGPARSPGADIERRHKDIAHSAQAMYEKTFFHLLAELYELYGCRNLALGGGCAFNSVANGKIRERTPFRKAYIQAAAGDAGGALGAALHTWYEQSRPQRSFRMDHAYWGPGYTDDEINECLVARRSDLLVSGCRALRARPESLLTAAAKAISDGAVLGWFQGRMEWGPRALGNRSILCDPRRADMKEILNAKIKRRESFRPFAPTILREEVANWFEIDDDVPFMMKVFKIREERQHVIPSVTHVDGTGRLQTVTREQNSLFYDLVRAFYDLTGVPILLNTSFNENEPIVCKPEEAIDCFLRTNMDVLVLGSHILSRPGTGIGEHIRHAVSSADFEAVTSR